MIGNGDLFFIGLQVKFDPSNDNELTTGSLELTAPSDTLMLRHPGGRVGYIKKGEYQESLFRYDYLFEDLDGIKTKITNFDTIYTVLSQIPYTDF